MRVPRSLLFFYSMKKSLDFFFNMNKDTVSTPAQKKILFKDILCLILLKVNRK